MKLFTLHQSEFQEGDAKLFRRGSRVVFSLEAAADRVIEQ